MTIATIDQLRTAYAQARTDALTAGGRFASAYGREGLTAATEQLRLTAAQASRDRDMAVFRLAERGWCAYCDQSTRAHAATCSRPTTADCPACGEQLTGDLLPVAVTCPDCRKLILVELVDGSLTASFAGNH